jgi:hypothetical protein
MVVAHFDEDSLSFYMNNPDFLDQFKIALPRKIEANHVVAGRFNNNSYWDFVILSFKESMMLIYFDLFKPQSL